MTADGDGVCDLVGTLLELVRGSPHPRRPVARRGDPPSPPVGIPPPVPPVEEGTMDLPEATIDDLL